jgi:hypothetical protein
MFMGMGMVHILGGLVLGLAGSDDLIVYSQLIGGLLEFGLGFHWYLTNDGEIV